MKLEGKVAIVTGGGQGIGRGIVENLAREGADVVIAGRTLSLLKETAQLVEKAGRQALTVPTDISKSEQVNAMVKATIDRFGRIDILVNNAAFISRGLLIDLSEELWDNTFNTNLKGYFLCCQAAGREMIKQRHGKIINITTGGAHLPIPGQGAYCASKRGVISLTQSLAIEWGMYNINVNAVSPGITDTPALARARIESPEIMQRRAQRIPLQRIGTPEDIAKAVVFLGSSDSDYITGDIIRVDGGSTVIHPGFV